MGLLSVGSDDTICAVATPPGKGGIAVIRVSGSAAKKNVKTLMASLPDQPESHRVYYGFLEFGDQQVDQVLATFFAKGRSFTGEETVEVSCHGGTVVTNFILDALVESGCRIAEPGEFTFRSFMNNRIDLIQAEGVLDLIESETRQASSLALKQLKGGLSSRVHKIETGLTRVLAHVEANIDFAAEDIVIASNDELCDELGVVIDDVDELLGTYRVGKAIHDGLEISIVGEPNVGKSSLLNALTLEEKAIVTDIAGTTRDVVEGEFLYEGVKFNLFDTAGIRPSDDAVEKIGIQRAMTKASETDLTFVVVDGSSPRLPELIKIDRDSCFLLVNKVDLCGQLVVVPEEIKSKFEPSRVFCVSAASNIGLDDLKAEICRQYGLDSELGHSALLTNSRHLSALKGAKVHLTKGQELLKACESPDLVSFELMEALENVHSMLGKRFDDEVLDQVFRQFCLGK